MTNKIKGLKCDVAPSCLLCPLDYCKFDDPVQYKLDVQKKYDDSVIAVIQQGTNSKLVAEQFGIHVRTVYNIMKRRGYGKDSEVKSG